MHQRRIQHAAYRTNYRTNFSPPPLHGHAVAEPPPAHRLWSCRHCRPSPHLHTACCHRVADAQRHVDVPCEHAALQRQPAGVAVLHRLLRTRAAHDGQQRPKRLLPGQAHAGRHVVHQARPDQVPLTTPLGQKLGPWEWAKRVKRV